MYKKAWCTCTAVVLPNTTNTLMAFLTSSLPSPSSLLKLLGSLGPSEDCLFFNIWKLSHVQKWSWENWKWFLDQICYRRIVRHCANEAEEHKTFIKTIKDQEKHKIEQIYIVKSHDYRIMVARYSFSGSAPPKFEHKLRRHKQRFWKIATTVVLDKDENLLWSGLQRHRSCHSNEMTLLPILLAAIYLGTGNCSSKIVHGSFFLK